MKIFSVIQIICDCCKKPIPPGDPGIQEFIAGEFPENDLCESCYLRSVGVAVLASNSILNPNYGAEWLNLYS